LRRGPEVSAVTAAHIQFAGGRERRAEQLACPSGASRALGAVPKSPLPAPRPAETPSLQKAPANSRWIKFCASCMLGKCPTTGLYHSLSNYF
jgi:hypothetical protein